MLSYTKLAYYKASGKVQIELFIHNLLVIRAVFGGELINRFDR